MLPNAATGWKNPATRDAWDPFFSSCDSPSKHLKITFSKRGDENCKFPNSFSFSARILVEAGGKAAAGGVEDRYQLLQRKWLLFHTGYGIPPPPCPPPGARPGASPGQQRLQTYTG